MTAETADALNKLGLQSRLHEKNNNKHVSLIDMREHRVIFERNSLEKVVFTVGSFDQKAGFNVSDLKTDEVD
jgi:hypothetical protein